MHTHKRAHAHEPSHTTLVGNYTGQEKSVKTRPVMAAMVMTTWTTPPPPVITPWFNWFPELLAIVGVESGTSMEEGIVGVICGTDV